MLTIAVEDFSFSFTLQFQSFIWQFKRENLKFLMFEDIVISDLNSIILLYFRFNDLALSSRNVARNFTKIR